MKFISYLTALLVFTLATIAGPRLSRVAAVSAAEPEPVEMQQPDAASFLPGRTWQLVEIVSMNDEVAAPEERSLYTIVFKSDGTAQIKADCNRGTGGWTSSSPGKLEFSRIAATRALCPPNSLHDSFMALFPYVRSYVVKDGHLFLATMADGSITEFEPVALPLAAVVLGEEVRTDDPDEMQRIVLTRLFDHYAEEQGIAATDEEIDMFVERMRRNMSDMGLDSDKDLTAEEKAQAAAMRREMGRSMIQQWKINRRLHEQYGGRVIFQQFGPEPLDAYRQYLEERRDAADFEITNKDFEKSFWRYFTDDSMHSFYESGSTEEAQAFSTPPWMPIAAGPQSKVEAQAPEAVPAAPEDGGPLNWEVVSEGGLRLRAEPSTSADIVSTLKRGTILDNLGCQQAEGRAWCFVQAFGGGPVGFVAAEFLQPAVGPDGGVATGPDNSALRAGQGDFDATGTIPCALAEGQPLGQCDFGVARHGGGFATVVVKKGDGMDRALFFRRGVATSADTSEADGYHDFSVTKEGDLYRIRVGPERYEVPEAVVFGG